MPSQRTIHAILLILLWPAAAARADNNDSGRVPVPDMAAQERALELVHSIFEKQYAATGAEVQAALAKELLKQAVSLTDDPASEFVLYREAITIASRLGDVDTALAAQNGMIDRFQVRPANLRLHVLTSLAKSAEGVPARQKLATACLEAAREAAGEDRFDPALRLLTIASATAKKTRSATLLKDVRETAAQIESAKKSFDKISAYTKSLEEDPDDPQANLAMGRYLCFAKGDWEAGLPRLAKGSDKTLAALAGKALQPLDDAQKQYEVAKAWWDAANDLPPGEQGPVRTYAATWFQQALPGLSGLPRAMAEKRIAEAGPATSLTPPSRRRTINLIQLIDPVKDALRGRWTIENGTLVCHTGSFVPRIQIPYQPPEEYDYKIVFSQPALRNPVMQAMPGKGGHFYWQVGGRDGQLTLWIATPDGRRLPERKVPGSFAPGQKYTSVVEVRRDGVRVLVNGTKMGEFKTDFQRLVSNPWYRFRDTSVLGVGCDDPTVFHTVEVTEITGKGKLLREESK